MKYSALVVIPTFALTACNGSPPPPTPPEATISISATVGDEGLPDVPIVAKRGPGSKTVRTDAEGEALFRFRTEGSPITLEAACPEGYEGPALQRTIHPARLKSAGSETSQWLLSLACESKERFLPIALLGKECPFQATLNGSPLGRSEGGALHALFRSQGRESLALKLSSTDDSCTIKNPAHVISPDQSAVFLAVESSLSRSPRRPVRSKRKASRARPIRL